MISVIHIFFGVAKLLLLVLMMLMSHAPTGLVMMRILPLLRIISKQIFMRKIIRLHAFISKVDGRGAALPQTPMPSFSYAGADERRGWCGVVVLG